MKKVISIFIFSIIFAGLTAAHVFSQDSLSGSGSPGQIEVKPASANYYLAAFTGESEFYDPTFYDDYLLIIDGKPAAYFTKVDGQPADFYFYSDGEKDIQSLNDFFDKNSDRLNQISPRIIPAFKKYAGLKPRYVQKNIYHEVSRVIKKISNVTSRQCASKVIGDKVDAVLYRYLRSNGVESLGGIKRNRGLMNMLVNKFYMLSTTGFYREWVYVKAFKDYLEPLKAKAQAQGRPFKVKVFACSTGEEVLTYAIELLESGIKNFTILASDINDSSLDFARKMNYSYNSFSRLSLVIQEKLKKYFRLNETARVWELKDPDFFRSRIKFINHDILEDLPADLDKDFSPPYDLVSILNVLLYLDEAAVQEKKNYWLSILGVDGILVLHDAKHSLTNMDIAWAFKNFYVANEWVNIKTSGNLSDDTRVKMYERAFRDNPSDAGLVLLNWAYAVMGKPQMALAVAEDYLKKTDSTSLAAVVLISSYYSQYGKTEAFNRTAIKLLHTYIYPERLLDSVIAAEDNRNDKDFLKNLKKLYDYFLDSHNKEKLGEMENLFKFTVPSSAKWDFYRALLQIAVNDEIQGRYLAGGNDGKFEAITLESLSAIEAFLKDNPDFLIIAKFLDDAVERFMKYCVERKRYSDALAVADRATNIFANRFSGANYFFISYGLGNLNLYKATILEKQGRDEPAAKALDAGLSDYGRGMVYKQILGLSNLMIFYSKISQCYLLRGKVYLRNKKNDLANNDFKKSLYYLEQGLEVDPVYGKDLALTRAEVLRLIKAE
jgi:chemotaxis methyl-accepting protein methylase